MEEFDQFLQKQPNTDNNKIILSSMHFSTNRIFIKQDNKPILEKIVFQNKSKEQRLRTSFKFFKNKNIVENNKQNLDYNKPSKPQTSNESSRGNFFSRDSLKSTKNTLKTQRFSHLNDFRLSERYSYAPDQNLTGDILLSKVHRPDHNDSKGRYLKKLQKFKPKQKEEIIKKHSNYKQLHSINRMKIDQSLNNQFYEDKLGLQRLLKKNHLYGQRCLIGLNIPKIQQKYSFSRFQLFNLYTYYKTLLKYSNESVKQFKKGFESILYINKIQLNAEMIQKCVSTLFQSISFQSFIQIYGNIQNLLFTQTIIEFMVGAFEQFYREEPLEWIKVGEVLKGKMNEGEAFEIREIMFDTAGKQQSQTIQLKDMLNVCHDNIAVCRKVFNTINKQTGTGKK